MALFVAALTTVIAAVVTDLIAVAEPSHTIALGIVALVVAFTRIKLAGRYDGTLSVVSGALVAQPALHATSRLHVPRAAHADGLAQAVTEGPITVTQVVVPTLVVIAVTSCSRVTALLLGMLRRRFRLLRASWGRRFFGSPRRPQTARQGSTLRWCGWALRCGRRGPPVALVTICV